MTRVTVPPVGVPAGEAIATVTLSDEPYEIDGDCRVTEDGWGVTVTGAEPAMSPKVAVTAVDPIWSAVARPEPVRLATEGSETDQAKPSPGVEASVLERRADEESSPPTT
jgi:predicted RNA-binding protein with TRAM domain